MKILISKYKTEIDELVLECEHVYRLTVDYDLLHQKLGEIFNRAQVDGLEERLLWDLIHARIPSYVNYLNHKVSKKKAA